MDWKDVVGFEGLYKVAEDGSVYSFKSNRLLKARNTTNGYLAYSLRKDNKYHQITVHRLVATAFLPNPDNLADVHHKDENKHNNCYTNLEWSTHVYNVTASVGKAVMRDDGKVYESAASASRDVDCEPSHITACCKGKVGYKTVRGYTWRYVTETSKGQQSNEHVGSDT